LGIDWTGLKGEYASGRETVSALAGKYGCHEDSIRRKARNEGWVRKPGERAGRAPESRHGALPARHRDFWKGVEKRLEKGLKAKDVKQGLEELKVAKMAGDVISSMTRGKMLEMGLDDSGENGFDDSAEIVAEMARVTVPPGAAEDVD